MNARLLTSAALIGALFVALPGRAADPQLLTLVMPDATVLAGVNVQQAITTPFGQYVLMQIQSQQQQQLQALISATGFDPTKDVTELLVASDAAPAGHSGLALARGNFPVSQIAAAATLAKAVTETYGGVTILEDPKQLHGFAFPNGTLVIAGDLASVKAAIDRLKTPASLPAAVTVQVNQWSGTHDAWVITTVPPSALHPPSSAPKVPGVGGQAAAFQAIQSGAAGVKFGSVMTLSAQAQAGNAADAQSMANVLQMLASMAQLQTSTDPAAAALAQSLKISVSGNAVNITASMPEAQFEQLAKPRPMAHKRPARHM